MGLFKRWLSGDDEPARVPESATPAINTVQATICEGRDDLEIVGEAHRQDELWRIVGQPRGTRCEHPVIAMLLPEDNNPYDSNAISVWIDGHQVGYLARSDAELYRPGLLDLERRTGGRIALRGVVVGGGMYSDGPGRLGVWLKHDRFDFGLMAPLRPPAIAGGEMRTGLSEAIATDEDDDSYDLSWLGGLPSDAVRAIAQLRSLLASEADPIDRHFMFCELESRLYRRRDATATALNEYDTACVQHDSEMEAICRTFRAKHGSLPMFEIYRQMAIRQQKAKNWAAVIYWCERGLAVYGSDCVRLEAVEDLQSRRNKAQLKLSASG